LELYAIKYNFRYFCYNYIRMHIISSTAGFVKEKRKHAKLTQTSLAERAGVALTVIRKIEQGKGNLNLDKVNQVLALFGHGLAPVSLKELKTEK
jgi:y4mF family transcriptional regulator